MSKNIDYTTGNLLGYEHFSNHYKIIAIDLSKQSALEKPDLKQQNNFVGKVEDDNATMIFIIEKSEGTTFNFSETFVNIK